MEFAFRDPRGVSAVSLEERNRHQQQHLVATVAFVSFSLQFETDQDIQHNTQCSPAHPPTDHSFTHNPFPAIEQFIQPAIGPQSRRYTCIIDGSNLIGTFRPLTTYYV